MATVVLAWEYERSKSSLNNLRTLQKELISKKHDAYLVGVHLPDLDSCDTPFLQAPQAPIPVVHKSGKVIKIGGFADRLTLLGFNERQTLHCLVNGWSHLFHLLKPKLLIADCAPVACLAAYEQLPVIHVTDGFSLPPTHLGDFPRLRPDGAPLITTRLLLENIQQVQKQRGKSIPPDFAALFKSKESFITHSPEFDPYLSFRNKEQTFGVFKSLAKSLKNKQNEPYFFAYLETSYPDIEEIIIGLTDLDIPGIFYIPKLPKALRFFLESRQMILLDNAEDLARIIAEATYVIHHGNLAVAEVALNAGSMQFTLPYNFETEWISNKLNELRVGLTIYPSLNPIHSIPEIISATWRKSSLKEWVNLRSAQEQQKGIPNITEHVLDTCINLL